MGWQRGDQNGWSLRPWQPAPTEGRRLAYEGSKHGTGNKNGMIDVNRKKNYKQLAENGAKNIKPCEGEKLKTKMHPKYVT